MYTGAGMKKTTKSFAYDKVFGQFATQGAKSRSSHVHACMHACHHSTADPTHPPTHPVSHSGCVPGHGGAHGGGGAQRLLLHGLRLRADGHGQDAHHGRESGQRQGLRQVHARPCPILFLSLLPHAPSPPLTSSTTTAAHTHQASSPAPSPRCSRSSRARARTSPCARPSLRSVCLQTIQTSERGEHCGLPPLMVCLQTIQTSEVNAVNTVDCHH